MTVKTTKTLNPSDCNVKWHLVDATDMVVGRLAAQVATILRGKDKTCFSPSQDCGDYVVVINASKMKFTGKKLEDKMYHRHTGYVGGLKSITAGQQMEEHPERVLIKAVERMLTRGPLGRQQMKKLRVFAGAEHPHAGQNPEVLDLASKNSKNKRSV